MHTRHAEIISLMNDGYVFVREVHNGSTRAYFLQCAGHKIDVSESTYYKMSEMDYIQTNGRHDPDKDTVWRLYRLTAKYRESAPTKTTAKPGPFASLRDMVYTECPCGCGNKEVCDAQLAHVKAHNDALPF